MVRFNRFYPALILALFLTAAVYGQAQQPTTTSSVGDTVAAQETQQQAQPTQQQRAQVLRQAQERVRARRRLRDQQTIRDTYTHKYEAYFGGNYLRFHPGDTKQHINESGWHAGVTDYAFGKIGITAEGRGYYGTTYAGRNEFGVYQPSISQYTFMAGPTVRFFEGLHWGWTANVLAGIGHGNFGTGTNGLPPELIGLYKDGNAFNASAGVSVDYNLSPGLALRLTPNYLYSGYGSSHQHNLGFNAGVVYRWGRQ